jgi:Lar family restriction alleviation protein
MRRIWKMANLKTCPFCGGKATPVYCENGNRYTSNMLMLSKRGTVKCKKCEVCLPRVYSKVAKAIEAWNRRNESEELKFTRQFIHEHGLEFALASAWSRRAEDGK